MYICIHVYKYKQEARIPWELVYATQRRLYARAFGQPGSDRAGSKRGAHAVDGDMWLQVMLAITFPSADSVKFIFSF